MNDRIVTKIETAPLSIQEAIQTVQAPQFGALDVFIGTVRATNLGRDVVHVHYDLFEPLVLKTLRTISAEVANQIQDPLAIYVSHFKGELLVGEISVIIAVGAPHRREAFLACRSILEALKMQAPIWKQEKYTNGCSEWVQGHALCQSAHAATPLSCNDLNPEHVHA